MSKGIYRFECKTCDIKLILYDAQEVRVQTEQHRFKNPKHAIYLDRDSDTEDPWIEKNANV